MIQIGPVDIKPKIRAGISNDIFLTQRDRGVLPCAHADLAALIGVPETEQVREHREIGGIERADPRGENHEEIVCRKLGMGHN